MKKSTKKILLILKHLFALLLCATAIITTSSCKEEKTISSGYTFEDELGRTITVSNPKRVAALLGSFTDMWILAGGSVCASADDAWSDFHLPLTNDVVNLGTTHSPSLEQIFLSEPQLVIASAKSSKHLEMESPLESAGITVAYFDVSNFESFLNAFKIMTDITGRNDLYQKHGLEQKQKIDEIINRNKKRPPQTVLVLRASVSSIKVKNSQGTMLGGMLYDFGCINIADSDSQFLEDLSIESIIQKNPDKIFFVEMGDDSEKIKKSIEKTFSENPLWNELTAVKSGKVYYMDKHLYNLKPNAKFVDAYKNLELILYENSQME